LVWFKISDTDIQKSGGIMLQVTGYMSFEDLVKYRDGKWANMKFTPSQYLFQVVITIEPREKLLTEEHDAISPQKQQDHSILIKHFFSPEQKEEQENAKKLEV
jgi:hypothetical protein